MCATHLHFIKCVAFLTGGPSLILGIPLIKTKPKATTGSAKAEGLKGVVLPPRGCLGTTFCVEGVSKCLNNYGAISDMQHAAALDTRSG